MAAIPYREAMQRCFPELTPFGEAYSLLYDQVRALDAMLETITGRSIDYRGAHLGLLPLKGTE